MTPRALLAALPILLSLLGSLPSRAQSLREILFLTEDGMLCSVSADGARRVCLPHSFFDEAVWRPGTTEFVGVIGHSLDAEDLEPDSLYLYDRDGRPLRPLRSSLGYGAPAWSPDGRFLYAAGQANGTIARWDAEGRSRSILHVTGGEPGARARILAFSPSGSRVALIRYPELGVEFGVELADVSPDGFQVSAVLAKDFERIASAVWRDEDHLLFLGSRHASRTVRTPTELWELSVSDGGVRRLRIDSLWGLRNLVLSPDRSTVIVSASTDPSAAWRVSLWSLTLATGRMRQLLTGGDADEYYATSWSDQPAEGECGVCSLEGNARMIRFMLAEGQHLAWWWDIDLRAGLGLVETYRDPAELWATSILRPGGGQPSCEADPNWGCQFSPSRAFRVPPDSTHAWCEGVAGDGIGEILIMPAASAWAGSGSQGADLRPPGTLTGLRIRPGYGKSPALFLANGRPRQLHVSAVHRHGTEYRNGSGLRVTDLGTVELRDANTWQSVRLPEVNLENLLFIALEIRSVYPGTRYHDTCISGVLPARTQTAPRH